MSSLNSMTVQGIRSFSPNTTEKIKFESPVTIIVGPNGSGKTTLIECLKYITTGSFPIGIKGPTFVQDPKITNSTEVKGQIRLQLRSVKDSSVTLTRSMSVTQKKTTPQFKTLDSLVEIYPKHGEPTKLSGKCVDFVREAVTHLGVPTAVLNNVLFCHQEDSNWPLSESKNLKSRFDDIFSAKKYNQAIDTIRKLQKDQENDNRVTEQVLINKKQIKEEAENKRANLLEIEQKIKNSEELITDIKKQLKPMEENLKKIQEATAKLNNLKLEQGKVKAQIDASADRVKSLKSTIKQIYAGDDDELDRELKDFKTKCDEKQRQKIQLESQKEKLQKDVDSLNEQKNNLSMKKGKFEAEVENNQKVLKDRQKLVKEIASEYKISGYGKETLTDAQIAQFFVFLDGTKENLIQTMNKSKAEFKEKEDALNRETNEIVQKLAAFQQTAKLKEDFCRKSETEIQKLQTDLKNIDSSQKRLNYLENAIRLKEEDLTSAKNDVDEEALKNEIATLQSRKKSEENTLNQLRDERKIAQDSKELHDALERYNKEKANREKRLDEFMNRHREVLDTCLGEIPPEKKLRSVFDRFVKDKTEKIEKLTKTLQEKRVKSKELEVKRNNFQDKIDDKENCLQNFDHKIAQASTTEDEFESDLRELTNKLDDMYVEKGTIDGAKYLYDKYVGNLTKKSCCPLCRRDFATKSDAEKLIDKLKENLTKLPEKAENLRTKISDEEARKQVLTSLRSIVDQAKQIRATDLPNLNDERNRLSVEHKKLQNEISTMNENLTKMQEELSRATKISSDIVLIDLLQLEIRDFERKIEEMSRKLIVSGANSTSTRSLARIEEDIEDLEQRKENAITEIDRKQDRLQRFRERIRKIETELTNLRNERFEINEKVQRRLTIQGTIDKLLADVAEAKKDGEQARFQLKPFEDSMRDADSKQKKLKTEKEAQFETFNTQKNELERRRRDVETLTKCVDEFETNGVAKRLTTCKDELRRLDDDLTAKTTKLTTIGRQLTEINVDLDGQQARQRDLHDNLELRRIQREMSTLDGRYRTFDDEIRRVESTGLNVDMKKFHEDYAGLKNRCGQAEGKLTEQKSNREKLQGELNDDKYKYAVERFREQNIELTTCQVLVDDLRKYALAVEHALLKYHEEKMKEINEYIKALWNKVYRGGDIDYIQVKAETDTSGSADKKRRVYNYRVVMYVNNRELDMRGRCSAGQKVLASIIIRIALADVFCTNCGVLALDEPTTNLDSENIESLAEALAEIIDARSTQKHFQLILITHDTKFVSLLLRQHPVDCLYRVYKDDKGFSQLERVSAAGYLED